jgi:hypothetical protein
MQPVRSMDMPKPIEFDSNEPLEVEIEKDRLGNWEINVSSTKKFKGTTPHSQRMQDRVEKDTPTIDQEYTSRRAGGAPDRPHFRRADHHFPAVVRVGETVRFSCNKQFSVRVRRDPDVQMNANSPETPFAGFNLAQIGRQINPNLWEITAVVLPNTKDQRFYKCEASIVDGAQTIDIDPCIICDT